MASNVISPEALIVTQPAPKKGAVPEARLHRPTCKRIPEGAAPVAKVLGFRPYTVATAKAASCCKPGADLVAAAVELGQAALDDSGATTADTAAAAQAEAAPKHFSPQRATAEEAWGAASWAGATDEVATIAPVSAGVAAVQAAAEERVVATVTAPAEALGHAAESLAHAAEVLAHAAAEDFEAADAEAEAEEQPTAVADYRGTMAKSFWKALAKEGAPLIAAAFGAHAEPRWGDLVVEVAGAQAEDAAASIREAWVAAGVAFRTWKKTDEDYRAIPKGNGLWEKAYAAQLVFLTDFCRGWADLVAGSTPSGTEVTPGYAAGQEAAGAEPLL